MSTFRDFNDEGPGTYEWDYVIGGNTTGMFPDEAHYVVMGNSITEALFTHTGGHSWEPVYGDSWEISDVSEMQGSTFCKNYFTFRQNEETYKATINNKFRVKTGALVVDIEQIDQ